MADALDKLCNSDLDQRRWEVATVEEQLNYLLAVLDKKEDGSKLRNLNFGVVTAKMIEPADDQLLELIYAASSVADEMASEYGT